MLNASSLEDLKGKKNLLAFSAGGDSTALFFLLHYANIDFDIAIVNYNVRPQSIEEINYAKELASHYNLKCHQLTAPVITTNFEATARKIRYDFFEELVALHKYDNVLTGHHLGDRFEWMLMQFCKGSSCTELAGMHFKEEKESYTLLRPLLHLDKSELLQFLHSNTIKYFEDETNQDKSIARNSIRHLHAQPLLKSHLKGIKKSFEYIDEDRKELTPSVNIHILNSCNYFQSSGSKHGDIISLDKHFKKNGYLLSANERELLKIESSVVLGREILVTYINNYVFISPYKKSTVSMEKKFREECRLLKIEAKFRPYLNENQKMFAKLKKLLLSH